MYICVCIHIYIYRVRCRCMYVVHVRRHGAIVLQGCSHCRETPYRHLTDTLQTPHVSNLILYCHAFHYVCPHTTTIYVCRLYMCPAGLAQPEFRTRVET